ncbi:MAG: hypothetical protein HOF84_08780, partial [Rhodospirillales bacterium]|nr:hypothetical protein [Rhodospirillales bacterium]
MSAVLATAVGMPLEHAVAQQKLSISAKDCRRLVRHVARDDVTYKAGVDVRGRRLKGPPADVGGGSGIKIPTIIEFDVTRDLRSFLGGPKADAEAAAKAAQAASA